MSSPLFASSLSAKLLSVWSNKSEDKLEKILESWKELLNLTTELALESQQDLH